MKSPYADIFQLLQDSNIQFESFEHEPVFTSEQAAAVRGLSADEGAKSLLINAEGKHVLVVLPGNKKLSSSKLRKVLGVKDARFATPEAVRENMGCEIGSCYPLGNVCGLQTYVDESLGQNEWISFNPGKHDVSIRMRYDDYIAVCAPNIVDVSSDN